MSQVHRFDFNSVFGRFGGLFDWGSVAVFLLIAICGGAVGSLFMWWSLPKAPFDWGNFLGLSITAILAALIARGGLRDYVRRQERDEVSRRWVDEAFTKVGRLTAEDFERERTNWVTAMQMVSAAGAGVGPEVLGHLVAQLDQKPPALSYEHRRVLTLLRDTSMIEAFGGAYGHLRTTHVYLTGQVPALLMSLRQVREEARRTIIDQVQAGIERHAHRLEESEFPLVTEFAALAQDFEALGLTSHVDVADAGERLKGSLERFRTSMKPFIEMVRAEATEASGRVASHTNAKMNESPDE